MPFVNGWGSDALAKPEASVLQCATVATLPLGSNAVNVRRARGDADAILIAEALPGVKTNEGVAACDGTSIRRMTDAATGSV